MVGRSDAWVSFLLYQSLDKQYIAYSVINVSPVSWLFCSQSPWSFLKFSNDCGTVPVNLLSDKTRTEEYSVHMPIEAGIVPKQGVPEKDQNGLERTNIEV